MSMKFTDNFRAVAKEAAKRYETYVKEQKFSNNELKDLAIQFIRESDYCKRKALYEDWIKERGGIQDLEAIANPFYIGYGNPNAPILFVGKEKAFDIQEEYGDSYIDQRNKQLFLEESLNNVYHWDTIVSEELTPQEVQKTFDYSPVFAYSFKGYNTPFSKSHTWAFYSKVLSHVIGKELDALFQPHDFENSLFNHCFMSEMHHLPSAKTKHRQLSSERVDFLEHKFFRSFQVIVLAARPYLNNQFREKKKEAVKELFGVSFQKELLLDPEKQRLPAEIYRGSDNCKLLIVCNQLSGSAGYSKESLKKLSELIRCAL